MNATEADLLQAPPLQASSHHERQRRYASRAAALQPAWEVTSQTHPFLIHKRKRAVRRGSEGRVWVATQSRTSANSHIENCWGSVPDQICRGWSNADCALPRTSSSTRPGTSAIRQAFPTLWVVAPVFGQPILLGRTSPNCAFDRGCLDIPTPRLHLCGAHALLCPSAAAVGK